MQGHNVCRCVLVTTPARMAPLVFSSRRVTPATSVYVRHPTRAPTANTTSNPSVRRAGTAILCVARATVQWNAALTQTAMPRAAVVARWVIPYSCKKISSGNFCSWWLLCNPFNNPLRDFANNCVCSPTITSLRAAIIATVVTVTRLARLT
jgi:hypothetical protein